MGAQRCVQAVFAGLCAYEAAAIATGRLPTVSAVCRRRRLLEAVLLGFLLLHLHQAAARAPAVPGTDLTEQGRGDATIGALTAGAGWKLVRPRGREHHR